MKRINDTIVQEVVRRLSDAGVPLNAIKYDGEKEFYAEDGKTVVNVASVFRCGYAPSPVTSLMAAMFGGIDPDEATKGWEGTLMIWSSTHAHLHLINGCEHGCQSIGNYDGLEWKVEHTTFPIGAN